MQFSRLRKRPMWLKGGTIKNLVTAIDADLGKLEEEVSVAELHARKTEANARSYEAQRRCVEAKKQLLISAKIVNEDFK